MANELFLEVTGLTETTVLVSTGHAVDVAGETSGDVSSSSTSASGAPSVAASGAVTIGVEGDAEVVT